MDTFKTLEALEEYNKKQIGLLIAKSLKDNPEEKYEEDYFKRITQSSQHHKVFNSDWSNYYTQELADTLLPYADGYKTKGTLVYDGAELFIDSPKATQKVMSLSKDGKLISTAFFTYPKGVKIQQMKNTLEVEHFEIVVFAEVDKDNNIDMYLRFGEDFRKFLSDYYNKKKLPTSVSSVEHKVYKTTANYFKENFADDMVHFTQMKFLLNLLDIKYDEVVVEHYFVNSWWTDENDALIQEALLNDIVKFHIETKDIPDNEIIFITLYDDDRRVNLDEDGKNDKLKLVYSSSGKEVIYAIVDWVVNEHKVKGITKMGIAHEQFTGWEGVHGSTMNKDVFGKISDLKEVVVSDTIGEHDGEFYSGKDQSQTTNSTRFYRIDDNYIVTNCPPLIEIK